MGSRRRRTAGGLWRARGGRWGALVASCAPIAGCVPDSAPGEALLVVRSMGEPGTYPGQFSYPRAMATDGRALWVVDKSARIQQIDAETGRPGVWWRTPEFELGMPTGITVGPARRPDGSVADALYVADTHYHRVLVYAIPDEVPERPQEVEPTLLAQFGGFGQGPGQFIYPTDIAVLTSRDGSAVERIYVSEYGGNDRVSVFDADYDFLFAFGTQGDGIDPAAVEFARPQSMVIDSRRRELILTDACNHRLGRFSLDGELIGWIGSPDAPSDAPVRFNFPYGLELLADSTLLVTEFGGARVQHVDPLSGRSLGAFGAAGRAEGEVATPWTALVLGHETYVLDSGNNRILVTRLPGVEGGHG